ncbi:beta-ketoacyl-[acyl-carrier-protein] synthase family protein [Lachnotalea glycerini]|uniref:Beta-ketoacyl-[acyl-carrier-protein] synthase family protein n=1 Tax=Lachnotalea glycerini TaxID=1763509 RepID=A0A371JGS5_9FIRM|nr:beta-ketoacyl-[acyl-carrier-protein] synthase family protein [Lachnotalea glycerini]RDY31933.1 beta-ketoacyl-[acyl-carrier-protein] synthase family protein [Lachnotalea glycerini]
MRKRVAVTGFGIVCALGNDKKSVKEALMNNLNKMQELSKIKDYGVLNHVKVGRTDVDEPNISSPNDFDKSEIMARMALEEACLEAGYENLSFEQFGIRASLSLATSVMGSEYIIKYSGEKSNDAEWLIKSKAYASRMAKEFKIYGGVYTTSSACASGSAGLGIAFDLIKSGQNDVVLCGGTDHISDISVFGFKSLNTLSEDRCKPFDKLRDGINIGEGSAFFVFEEYEHAIKRNAKILGEIIGYGLANDAYHITSPDPNGEGAYHSMKMALDDIEDENLSEIYVNAHGTGTKANDEMELKAIKKAFGDIQIYMSSTKALTGHCLGAAGSIEFAFSLMFLEEGKIPKTANSNFDIATVENIRDEIPADFSAKRILSNSFAFGGNDATIIVEKYTKD